MIIEYWYRTIFAGKNSIQFVSAIVTQYGKECDIFDRSLSHEALSIEDDGSTLAANRYISSRFSGFGTIIARPGRKYHWKLKIVQKSGYNNHLDNNFGVIEATKCAESNNYYWWSSYGQSNYGYSYYSDGDKYPGPERYGEGHQVGDIIDVCLNLKDKNPYLEFAKNDKQFGKAFDLKEDTEYRLGVSLYTTHSCITLISFDVDY